MIRLEMFNFELNKEGGDVFFFFFGCLYVFMFDYLLYNCN